MNTKNTLLTTAVAAAIGIGVAAVRISSALAAEKMIKCYGVLLKPARMIAAHLNMLVRVKPNKTIFLMNGNL